MQLPRVSSLMALVSTHDHCSETQTAVSFCPSHSRLRNSASGDTLAAGSSPRSSEASRCARIKSCLGAPQPPHYPQEQTPLSHFVQESAFHSVCGSRQNSGQFVRLLLLRVPKQYQRPTSCWPTLPASSPFPTWPVTGQGASSRACLPTWNRRLLLGLGIFSFHFLYSLEDSRRVGTCVCELPETSGPAPSVPMYRGKTDTRGANGRLGMQVCPSVSTLLPQSPDSSSLCPQSALTCTHRHSQSGGPGAR